MGSEIISSLYKALPHSMQNLALNMYAFKVHMERYGAPFRRALDELTKTQHYSQSQIDEYQNVRLVRLIRYAYQEVPYYRELFDRVGLKPSDIKSKEDLHKIPVLTRKDVHENSQKLIAANYPLNKLIHGHTSGTTGTPLSFYWDKNTCVYTNAVDWRQKNWAGIEYGDPISLFLGRTIVPPDRERPPFWQKDHIHNQLWMSSFHMNEKNLPYYFDKLSSFKPLAVEGYPSTLYILARYLLKNNTTFPVKAAFTSSETLLPIQREVIEKSFKCKIYDFLGMAERVIFATECEHHSGHHLNFEYALNEVVDGDNNPVEQGQQGYLVGTSLQNFAMPFIRYKTSDVSRIRTIGCPCGRAMQLIDEVTTKAEDIVITPEGKMISSSVLTHPFKPLENIRESQIIQEDVHNLLIRIVREHGFDESSTQKLISSIKERVGESMNIHIEYVEHIPRTSSGKFRWVISKVGIPI